MHLCRSVAVAAALTSALGAQTLIVPNNVNATTVGTGSTSYPWNRDTATAASNDIRVQYVYDSANFSTIGMPIVITGARWRAADDAVTTVWNGGTYANCEVIVGEAGVDYTTLASGNTFASSYLGGVTPSPAYQGPVTVIPGVAAGFGNVAPWYVSVSFASPVLYDPTTGNDLVMEIAHDGIWSATPSDSVTSDTSSVLCRQMFNLSDWQAVSATGVSNVGIVCELTYTPAAGIFASFLADRTLIGPNETVNFTDISFSSAPGGVLNWAWDFNGDGTPDSTAQNPSWTFTSCGPHDVSLTVVDAAGSSQATRSNYIQVDPPVASFDSVATGSLAPITVQFNDTSANAPTAWDWDLDGDGNFGDSNQQNPQWVYMTENVFNIQMRATNACGTTTATAVIDTRRRLCTQFGGAAGWKTGSGFYMDVDVLNAAGLDISGLGVQIQNPGVAVTLDVYIKQGTHVGSETDRGLWTRVATGSGIGAGTPNETLVDISDFHLPQGLWGMVIEYTLPATERFNYTTSGPTNASNVDLVLSNGANFQPVFSGSGAIYQPRNWNGCIYYSAGQNAGMAAVIGEGCASSTGNIATLELQGGGVPSLGASLVFEIADAPPSQALASLMLGFSDLGGIDLAAIGMDNCLLRPDPILAIPSPIDPTGVGTAGFSVSSSPSAVGITFYVQGFIGDPGQNVLGAVLSNAVAATVGQ